MSSLKCSETDSNSRAEGCLAKRLHSSFDLTIEKFLSGVKYSTFKKNFYDIYKYDRDELKRIYDELISQIRKNVTEDLKKLCAEHCIDILLTALEKVNEQKYPQECWRPSGNPEEDLRDHIYALKVKHKEALQNVLTKLVAFNEELDNKTACNHAEIMHLKKTNDHMHEKFNEIVGTFNGPELENLQRKMETIIDQQF